MWERKPNCVCMGHRPYLLPFPRHPLPHSFSSPLSWCHYTEQHLLPICAFFGFGPSFPHIPYSFLSSCTLFAVEASPFRLSFPSLFCPYIVLLLLVLLSLDPPDPLLPRLSFHPYFCAPDKYGNNALTCPFISVHRRVCKKGKRLFGC